MSNELERSLVALGGELAVPATPDLVPGVLAGLERRPSEPRWAPRRRLALAVAVGLLAVLGATLAIPDARSAFLRVLHLGGERIERVDELPPVELQHDLELTLGERVTLEEAESSSGFALRGLDQEPDRVYLGDRGTVWFLYGTPEKPRLLLAQTPRVHVTQNDIFLKKLSSPDTTVEHVAVGGAPGLFISGAAHLVILLDENGEVIDDTPRLARDVLIWETGGVAYRLEGEFELDEALRIAGTLSS